MPESITQLYLLPQDRGNTDEDESQQPDKTGEGLPGSGKRVQQVENIRVVSEEYDRVEQ